ncbi:MAG TPA: TonB family protein [Candidatus Dormibacteraeota bacterium]|nr:TonB family protein [Candidatus Dormibacteraeota bacterium]
MAPLTKDSVEAASPVAGTPAAQTGTQSKPTSSLRADALSLEVAVKVHGSRVIEVARGTAPRTEPFEEQTVTMIVFPQGAVLRMATAVNVSQMLVLTNIKTKQDSICRVLKVRPNANQGSYVEVEFTHRQPGYWGVQFPSEGSVATNTIAPPQVNLESQKIAPASPTPATRPPVTTAPRDSKPASVAPTAPFVPPAKPESSFISIGSQEKVQEAASATAITKPLSPAEMRIEGLTAPFAKTISAVDPVPAQPSAPPAVSMDDLRGDSDSVSSSPATVTEEHSTSATSSASRDVAAILGDAGSDASQTSAPEAFGARLDSSFGSSVAQSSGTNQNWMLIAACVAVLVAGLGAGIAYFRQRAGNPSAPRTASSAANASSTAQPATDGTNQLPAITPAGQPYMAKGGDVNAAARPGDAPSAAAPSSSANNAAKAPASPASHSPAPAKQTTPGVTSDMVSTALTSRPTTWTRGSEGQTDQAPVLDAASASGSSPLPGITGPNAAALPMPAAPEGPTKIGGNVKEPKLLNSVAPAYPLGARSSGVQGDVVIETTIDKTGNVVRTHVVSGPAMLRPSALEALKRWKYEPSRLNGEPVEVQMQVTIRFRL